MIALRAYREHVYQGERAPLVEVFRSPTVVSLLVCLPGRPGRLRRCLAVHLGVTWVPRFGWDLDTLIPCEQAPLLRVRRQPRGVALALRLPNRRVLLLDVQQGAA